MKNKILLNLLLSLLFLTTLPAIAMEVTVNQRKRQKIRPTDENAPEGYTGSIKSLICDNGAIKLLICAGSLEKFLINCNSADVERLLKLFDLKEPALDEIDTFLIQNFIQHNPDEIAKRVKDTKLKIDPRFLKKPEYKTMSQIMKTKIVSEINGIIILRTTILDARLFSGHPMIKGIVGIVENKQSTRHTKFSSFERNSPEYIDIVAESQFTIDEFLRALRLKSD